MNDYLRTALSGWAGVIFFGSGLAMPYLLRGVPGVKTSPSTKPHLRRMWPHYWLGYLVFFASFIHAWFAMRHGDMRGIGSSGVWVATIAWLILLWQIAVGIMLQNPSQSHRRALRRTHFWTMALVAALLVVHIALNKP